MSYDESRTTAGSGYLIVSIVARLSDFVKRENLTILKGGPPAIRTLKFCFGDRQFTVEPNSPFSVSGGI
jgi:hypothetical protein